jgi:serine/threonine-protein kinase
MSALHPALDSHALHPDGPHAFGRFRLLRLLGDGGMSEVYLGYDLQAGAPVAIKVLSEQLAHDPIQLDRFRREAELTNRLRHPNLIRGLDQGVDLPTRRVFFAMEFVDGPSAQSRLDSSQRLSVSDVVHIGSAIAKALEYLHARNFVHRDIKPDNILLAPDGEAKLADLGLVRWAENDSTQLTGTGDGFGTAYYMPLEQGLNAHFVDGRSDIFALGATLYHLLTGRVPFPGEDHRDIMRMKEAGHYTPVSLLNPEVPPGLEKILDRMLAPKPRERYQTATDVVVALERTKLAEGLPSYADLGLAPRDVRHRGRQTAQPTRPDLRLHASMLKRSRAGNYWYLRYRNRHGRMALRKGTTEQVLKGLESGRIKGVVLAARQRHLKFRPLSEFPEFHSWFAAKPSSMPVPIGPVSPRLPCWYRRMLAGLGFSVIALAGSACLVRLLLAST